MRAAILEWLGLVVKTILFVVGGILVTAALVELAVGGPWFVRGATATETFEKSAGLILLFGLALCIPPLAFAFRDAYREARKGRRSEP